jgi:Rrf2 family protein
MEMVKNPVLRVSAKLDYAVRALAELAREAPRPLKGDVLATRQAIPFRFLEVTLGELRQAGLVCSRRGSEGGYWLDRPPADITLAEISVAVEGSLVDLRAVPNGLDDGTAETVREVWDAAHRRLAEILGSVTLADLVNGALPATVRPLGPIGAIGPVGSAGSIASIASVEPAESAD